MTINNAIGFVGALTRLIHTHGEQRNHFLGFGEQLIKFKQLLNGNACFRSDKIEVLLSLTDIERTIQLRGMRINKGLIRITLFIEILQ